MQTDIVSNWNVDAPLFDTPGVPKNSKRRFPRYKMYPPYVVERHACSSEVLHWVTAFWAGTNEHSLTNWHAHHKIWEHFDRYLGAKDVDDDAVVASTATKETMKEVVSPTEV